MDYVKQYLNVEGIIGQGTFGKVLVTSLVQHNQQQQLSPNQTISNENRPLSGRTRFALKCIHPIIKPQRLGSELRFLRDLGGTKNVVQMHSAYFEEGALFIVMDLIEHDRFIDIVALLDHEEILNYMKNLLIALEWVHSNKIIHRDIKPANFLFNRRQRKFLLVDFGLAQSRPCSKDTSPGTPNISTKRLFQPTTQLFKKLCVSNNNSPREPITYTADAYESPVTQSSCSARHQTNQDSNNFTTPKVPRRDAHPKCNCRGKPRTCRICSSRPELNVSRSGTPGFKAPEILLRSSMQTTAIDIWSAGVIMFSLLSGHTPMFRDTDDLSSLSEMITIFGSERIIAAALKIKVRLDIEPQRKPVDLRYICEQTRLHANRPLHLPESAYDLLRLMLEPNPMARITASAALKHRWFSNSMDK